MDTALINGDFKLDARGIPFYISDTEEILQMAYIRLKVKKGSFIYDKAFGSELFKLDINSIYLQEEALSLARETLDSMSLCEVDNVIVTNDEDNLTANLQFYLSINGNNIGKVDILI